MKKGDGSVREGGESSVGQSGVGCTKEMGSEGSRWLLCGAQTGEAQGQMLGTLQGIRPGLGRHPWGQRKEHPSAPSRAGAEWGASKDDSLPPSSTHHLEQTRG